MVVDKKVTTQLQDAERDNLCAACLCGGFGVLLTVIEGIFGMEWLRQLQVEFAWEDLLLGASALFVLSEEFVLARKMKGG